MCCLLLPQTVGCYWLLQWSNPVSIGCHSDQTSFQSSSLYLWALRKHCFVKMSSSTLCCTVFLYNVFAFRQGEKSSKQCHILRLYPEWGNDDFQMVVMKMIKDFPHSIAMCDLRIQQKDSWTLLAGILEPTVTWLMGEQICSSWTLDRPMRKSQWKCCMLYLMKFWIADHELCIYEYGLRHRWAPSQISMMNDITLSLILKVVESDIMSDIGVSFLPISNILNPNLLLSIYIFMSTVCPFLC